MSQSGALGNIGVRNCHPADLPALVAAQQRAWSALNSDWQIDVPIDELLAREDVFNYLVEASVPIGCIVVGRPSEDWFEDGRTGEVLAWFLEPSAWGQGLGGKLLVQGLTVIKRRGWERALVWLPEGAVRAESIATRVGFEPVGSTRILNAGTGSAEETCFALNLEDWF